MIAHVVLFQPKRDVPAEDRTAFLAAIRAAAKHIPGVASATIGRTVSFSAMPPAQSSQSYEYTAIFEFADAAALERYLVHPVHDNLRAMFWRLCEATLIADAELFDAGSASAEELIR